MDHGLDPQRRSDCVCFVDGADGRLKFGIGPCWRVRSPRRGAGGFRRGTGNLQRSVASRTAKLFVWIVVERHKAHAGRINLRASVRESRDDVCRLAGGKAVQQNAIILAQGDAEARSPIAMSRTASSPAAGRWLHASETIE